MYRDAKTKLLPKADPAFGIQNRDFTLILNLHSDLISGPTQT